MSKLNDLINELCPNGVEYKRIGDIASVLRGKRLTKDKLSDDNEYPVFHGGLEPLGFYSQHNREAQMTMIINVGASAGTVGYSDSKFWSSDGCYCISHNDYAIPRYIYIALSCKQPYLVSKVRKAGIPTLDAKVVENVSIPVPPLEVQREIVRVLDSFTLLTAELTAELTARKKQYDYYRNELIKEKEHYPLVKLGSFASISRGGNFQKKDFVEEGFPCIHYGQMYTHFGMATDTVLKFIPKGVFEQSKKAVQNDIVMAVTSENVEDVCSCTAWLGKDDIAISGHTAIIHHNQNPKYLSYYFHTEHFFNQKKKLAHGTKVIEVTPNSLNDILIPLPTIEEQDRIVAILDRFDELCISISTGIPSEIKARQKQYEYYRDKLLSFKELGA